ncbi:MAG: hypothetical protein CMH37_02390 [Microbacterium sp.]|nr:hypothetical protein [Microbacterium sp.]
MWGWAHPAVISSWIGAAICIGAFVLRERHAADPLINLSIFAVRNVSGGNAIMAAVYAGNLSFFFVLTLWMQTVQGWSPLQTGLAFAPFPVVLGLVAAQMGRLIARYGFRRFLILGPALVVTGMMWLCFLPPEGSYVVSVLPGLLVMAVGYGLTFSPVYAVSTGGLPPDLAGTASGLVTTSQQIGGATGLAVIAGVATSIAGGQGTDVQALTAGYDAAMAFAAVFTLCAVVVAAVVIRQPRSDLETAGSARVRHGVNAPSPQRDRGASPQLSSSEPTRRSGHRGA